MSMTTNDWIWARLSSRYNVTAPTYQIGDVWNSWLKEQSLSQGFDLVDFYFTQVPSATTVGDAAYSYWSGGALGQAVVWLDAYSAVAGEQSVKNFGLGSTAYAARYGSATGVDTNDPALVTHTGTNYLYMSGVTGNYASTPDIAAYSPTASISYRFAHALDDWTPAVASYSGGHYEGGTSQRSSLCGVNTTGTLFMLLSSDGITPITATSTIAPTVADGALLLTRYDWIASGPVVRFYTKQSTPLSAYADCLDDTGWTQLGADITVSVPATLFATGSSMYVSGYTVNPHTGKIYATVVNVDGTTQVAVNFTTGITSGAQTTFTESSVNAATVTINRSVSGRKAVAVVRPVWLFGTDDYMDIPADPNTAYVRTTGVTNSTVQSTYVLYDTGTATAGAASTLDDTTKAWTAGLYVNRAVRITGGTGAGQVRLISSNTATQLTVSVAWTTIPDATSTYRIESRGNLNGDLEIVVRCSLDAWNSGTQALVARWDSATSQRSYMFLRAASQFALYTSSNGLANGATEQAALTFPLVDGTTYWLKVTKNTTTGVVTFYYAADQATEPSSWTTAGSATMTYAGAAFLSTSAAEIGSVSLGSAFLSAGKFYTAYVRDGIGGPPHLYWQASGHPTAGNYASGSRIMWTLGSAASVVNANQLNFTNSSSFTVVSVQRTWATPPASGTIISKWGGGAGWNIRNGFTTTTQPLIALSDSVTSQAFASNIPTLGALTVLAWVVEPTQVTTYTNTTAASPVTRTIFDSTASEYPVRIGVTAGGGSYNDFELVAVAVIPKALTAADVTAICKLYGTA